MKKINIIIPFYNECIDYIQECLDSVILSKKDFLKYYPDNEVMIYVSFDDKDNIDIIDYVKDLQRDDIIININDQRLGFAGNNNVLLHILPNDTDLVIRIDGDDVMVYNRIRITYEVFGYDFFSDVSIIGSNTTNPTYWNRNIVHLEAMLQNRRYNRVDQFKFNSICHSTIAFRYKDIVCNNIFYDEYFSCYGDLDFYLNVLQHNRVLMLIPDALVYYRNNNSNSILHSWKKEYLKEIDYIKHKYKDYSCDINI